MLKEGEVYRLNCPSPSPAYTKDGYLWVFLGVRVIDGVNRRAFKSVATGEVDWWPRNWMEELD